MTYGKTQHKSQVENKKMKFVFFIKSGTKVVKNNMGL